MGYTAAEMGKIFTFEATKKLKCCSFHNFIAKNSSLEKKYPGGFKAFARKHFGVCNKNLTMIQDMGSGIGLYIGELEEKGLEFGEDFTLVDAYRYVAFPDLQEEGSRLVIDTGAPWLGGECFNRRCYVWYKEISIREQELLAARTEEAKRCRDADAEEAKLCLRAAEQGSAEAQHKLGKFHTTGRGVPFSYEEALKWYRKAAEQGHAEALYEIGYMYDNSLGVHRKPDEALKYYRLAAKKGAAEAQYELGVMYENGFGVRKRSARAATCYRKAAEQGHCKAQVLVAQMYSFGFFGIPENPVEAMKWYRKAAEQGHAMAQCALAGFYTGDRRGGIRAKNAEAVRWYRKAAEQGYADAQYFLGRMYAKGLGVSKCEAAAAACYFKAGIGYLKKGKKDSAIGCVNRLMKMKNFQPNYYLAEKLNQEILEGK